jgi:hypothetical protein
MRSTADGAATTVFTGVIIALYVAFLRGTDLPLVLQRTRDHGGAPGQGGRLRSRRAASKIDKFRRRLR